MNNKTGVFIRKALMLTLVLFIIPIIVIAVENISPKWQNQGQNSTHMPQGGSMLLYSQGYDNETGLRYAWLETNETGVWENKSIFYLNSFNDSNTIKNVTFTGKENKTVWIRLPKNGNVLSAIVKLKGYPYPNTTVNTTDETSDWYGWYKTGGNVYVINLLNGNDTNYSSFAECAYASYPQPVGYCHFIENYTTPSSAKGATIFVKAGCPKNCMIEDWYVQCWNWTSNNSWIRVGQSKTPHWSTNYVIGNVSANITPESFPDCWGPQIITKTVTYDNIHNFSGLYEPNNGSYWESKIYWLDESYTNNPYLNVGEDTQLASVEDDTSDWYGWYKTGGNVYVINEGYYHDQNWNSFAECAYASYPQPVGYCHFIENYTVPYYAKAANIFVKAGCPKNCMIEDWYVQCWNWTSNNSWIRVGQSKTPHWSTNYVIGNVSANITPESFPDCWGPQIITKTVTYDNIHNFSGLYEPNNGSYWEGKITLYDRINLDSDYEWQSSGFYSGMQTTNDFSDEINDYLYYCLPDSSGYCNVPLMFHSETAGRIELSELNITYLAGNYFKSYNNIKGGWVLSNFFWKNDSIPAGTTIGWRIFYQDGDGNKNKTDIMTFKVKVPTNCSLTGITNHSYENSDTVICSCNGDGVTHLYRNDALHDEWNNASVIFAVGTFNWICNMTEGNIYAYSWVKNVQTISKLTPPIALTNNTSWTVAYTTSTNISGANCPLQLGCALYRNESAINAYYTMNNVSQLTWNETFAGSENKIFWINLLKNDSVKSIKMSLTGFYMPANTTISKSTSGERTMWMEFDGTYLWVSGTYNGRTYKHKPDEAPSTYYNFQGPITYDGTYLWTQNRDGGNITKRNYSNPNTILGQFIPPISCDGNISRGMTWGITYMGPQGSPSTNVGNHLIYYCDVNNTTAEPVYWLNETKGLEQGYCNSTNNCILKTCTPGYNIINDLTFDKTTNRLYGVFDSNPGGVGIFKLTVDNAQGYCPAGPTYTSIYPENITGSSSLALKTTDLTWYGTGDRLDSDPEFEKYYLTSFSNFYPSYVSLDAASDGDLQWNYSGSLTTKAITNESKEDVASYLSSCIPKPNGTCDVPFILHSDSQGIIQISEILVINGSATDSKLFEVGAYVYKYNTTGNDNYTSASITNTLTVVNCISNANCNDSNECTDNICINPGTISSYCSYPNSPQGTQCGLARDCPDDICNGFKGEFYPADGHDTCDGYGNCQQYSCAMQNSYCTDNDPFDGFNSLECNAECDQNSDCADKCIGEIRYYAGSCDLLLTCACSYSTEDCNSQNGWYDTTNYQWVSTGECTEKEQREQEYRDYTCSVATCTYDVTQNQWIDTGNTRNKDNGTSCDDGLFCTVNDVCTSGVCGGSSRDCSDAYNCTDDSCDETNDICLNAINDSNCVFPEVCRPAFFLPPTGCGVMTACTNKSDGTPCDDGLYCNGPDECQSSNCINVGPSIDCSPNNLQGIATCDWVPDAYHPTWDFRNAFTSVCDENQDICTTGDTTITHTCNQPTCGAACDENVDCSEQCNGKKWYSTYSCNLGTCGCDLSNPICSLGHCGAECAIDSDCPTGKTCMASCTCSDITPPSITILSPIDSAVYFSNSTPLTFTINKPTSWIGYSLDFKQIVTIAGNIVLTNLSDGSHNVIVYANDTSKNMGTSNRIYFTNNASFYLPWETSYIGTGGYPIIDIEEFNNSLYFASNGNSIYVFTGNSWNIIQSPVGVTTLKSYGGKLYFAGGPGKVYAYDGLSFSEVLSIDEPYTTEYLRMLGVYNNRFYAASYLDNPALLYYCDGSCDNPSNWHQDVAFNNTLICPPPFCSIDTMDVYNGNMYLGSGGRIYKYNGTWSILQNYSDVYAFMDMKVYNNKLYLATRDQATRCPMYAGGSGFCGRVIEYNGTNWNTVFDYSYPSFNGYWIYSLEVYKNRLYAGTAGKIYMYNGTTWTVSIDASLSGTPPYSVSGTGGTPCMTMKTWNDKIYAGWGNGVMFKDDLLEPKPDKPDLIIEDIWTSGSTIYYKIKNQGSANAGYTYSKLYIDGVYRTADYVASLTKGSSNTEYFSYSWICSGTSDSIQVCSDGFSYVNESNETNNCLTKTFTCPTTCSCTAWTNTYEICGENMYGCSYTYIRNCTPKGCNIESKCVFGGKYCIL